MATIQSDTFDLIPPFGGWNTPYNEYDCNEICAGDGDYTPWTKRDACVFCYVDVTVDNIGLTVDRNFHICKDCIHTDKGLEFLESQNSVAHCPSEEITGCSGDEWDS